MQTVVGIACFTLFFVNFASSGVLSVEKCKLEDSTCMQKASQKALSTFVAGIPELGTSVLDVLNMDDVDFDLSGLQFSLTGSQLTGLKNAVFDHVSFDTSKKEMKIEFHFDGELTGVYKARGRILVLPIEGDGDMTLGLKNLHLKIHIPYELETRNAKTHIVPKKLNFEFEVVDGATFALTNLFNGNKELSDNMLEFLNKDWKIVSVEFGKPLVQAATTKIFKALAIFFKKEALEDIAVI